MSLFQYLALLAPILLAITGIGVWVARGLREHRVALSQMRDNHLQHMSEKIDTVAADVKAVAQEFRDHIKWHLDAK